LIDHFVENPLAPALCHLRIPSFAAAASLAAEELPLTLRQKAKSFALDQNASALLLKGFRIDDATLMATPTSWDTPWEVAQIHLLEVTQALIASLFGEIFGWQTQENGRFFRHIIPHPADAVEQLGSSSAVDLQWHNEEAFHPARADWVVLMCYRNREQAIMTICPMSAIQRTRAAKISRSRHLDASFSQRLDGQDERRRDQTRCENPS